ncbi:MAG: hypothetical protein MUC69_08030 [Gemmatimonadales bacterium]|jgi:hypothetical protein|nr:hypothetical protein [Gemmatimonadales bacterium]
MSPARRTLPALLAGALLLGAPAGLWAQGRQQPPAPRTPPPRSQPAPQSRGAEARGDRSRERDAGPDRSPPPVRSTGEPELRRRRP